MATNLKCFAIAAICAICARRMQKEFGLQLTKLTKLTKEEDQQSMADRLQQLHEKNRLQLPQPPHEAGQRDRARQPALQQGIALPQRMISWRLGGQQSLLCGSIWFVF